jgi:hypothetical protein
MKDNYFQSVVIKLSNGKTGVFTGKCLVDKEDEGVIEIVDVKFTEPKELPLNTLFMQLDELLKDKQEETDGSAASNK